ncbi:MAG: hypothetical protein DRJ98_05950 [Thermoprotei archaeon]|nr:MAG: hypothetical protein DRJ98_05950 [Thermoprotei archaeon]
MFGRPIIQVEPTNHCNENCDICVRRYQKRELGFMDFDDFKRFVDLNRPYYLGFHGWGEPLLHEKIHDMVAYAASKGSITSLITNGTLVSYEELRRLFNSGLKELAFGVYRVEKLKRISKKVEYAVKIKRELHLKKPRLFLDIAFYEGNVDEVPAIIEEGRRLGIEAINLHRVFNPYDESIMPLSKERERELMTKVKKISKELGLKISLPGKHSLPCRVAKFSIFITWDFKITPCCFLPDLSFAHGPSIKVSDIVGSQSYKAFLKSMSKNTICSRCTL